MRTDNAKASIDQLSITGRMNDSGRLSFIWRTDGPQLAVGEEVGPNGKSDWKTCGQSDNDVGVYTTLRTLLQTQPDRDRAQCAILHLDYHLERLLGSAEELGLLQDSGGTESRIPADRFESLLTSLIIDNIGADRLTRRPYRIRLTAGGSNRFLLEFEPFESTLPLDRPIRLVSQIGMRPTPRHKSTRREVSANARRSAEQRDGHEALLIDPDGTVREGAWTNLFWVDAGGRLKTVADGILPGITRRVILENHDCRLVEITLQQLLTEAVEACVTQSTSGIVPVASIDGRTLPSAGENSVVDRLRRWYADYAPQRAKVIL